MKRKHGADPLAAPANFRGWWKGPIEGPLGWWAFDAPSWASDLVNEIGDDALRHYAPSPAARGDFLFRVGRLAEARSEFQAAATLTRNARERAFLLARADACGGQH